MSEKNLTPQPPSRSEKVENTPPVIGLRPGGGPMGLLREGEKSKDPRGTLLRLWGYLQRQRWVLAGTSVLVILTTAVDLAGPYLMGMAIDDFIGKGNLPGSRLPK